MLLHVFHVVHGVAQRGLTEDPWDHGTMSVFTRLVALDIALVDTLLHLSHGSLLLKHLSVADLLIEDLFVSLLTLPLVALLLSLN